MKIKNKNKNKNGSTSLHSKENICPPPLLYSCLAATARAEATRAWAQAEKVEGKKVQDRKVGDGNTRLIYQKNSVTLLLDL